MNDTPTEVDEAREGTSPEPATRRRRRWRRLLLAAPLLALLLWLAVSYTAWMLAPTSEPFGARSVEWIRAKMPFGNHLVDEVEHVYYTLNAPKTGGPQLKRLPVVGLGQSRRHPRPPPRSAPSRTQRGRRRSSRSSRTRSKARANGSRPDHRSMAARRSSSRPIGRTSNYPRLIAYVGWFDQHSHRARVLPRPIRAAARRRPRTDDGPGSASGSDCWRPSTPASSMRTATTARLTTAR